MKRGVLSWAARGLAVLIISNFCLSTISRAQAKVGQKSCGAVEWKGVELERDFIVHTTLPAECRKRVVA